MNDIMSSVKENILKILLFAAVVGLIIFAIVYRHKETIVIDKRYYTYVKAYQWDEYYYVSVSHQSCTGTGSSQKCTTTFRLERRTTTHIRCRSAVVGYDLPAKPPEMRCDMRGGDYVTESVTYAIDYHTATNQQGKSLFDIGKWNELPPESKQVIVTNVFNYIVEIKYE